MSRVISPAVAELIDRKVGIEPITMIAISWGSTVSESGAINYISEVTKYADKDILDSNGTVIVKGAIISMSDLDDVIKIDSGSSVGSLSVTLQDIDGELKRLFDSYDLHKRPVIVYQHFEGLDPTVHPWETVGTPDDPFEVFRGEVASPIVWSEGDRTLSFDIISKIYALEAGFAPEQGQFAYVPVDLIGKPWPMCFGTPIHVPAVKAQHVLTGTVMSAFGVPDYTLPYKHYLMTHIQEDLVNSFHYYRGLINVAQDIEVPAYQLQEDYANHIVSHDAMKQRVEDLYESIEEINRKIVAILAEYDVDDGAQRAELQAELQPLRDQRAPLNKEYRECMIQLQNMDKEADGYKLRLKNAKFETTIINRLRKKSRAVLGDYYQCTKQLQDIEEGIINQTAINTTSSAVMIGPEFPQNVVTLFDVNGLRLAGTMSGYSLTNIVAQPSYVNLIVDPRPSGAAGDDVTSLWLNEAQMQQLGNGSLSINLVGQYLWLQGQGDVDRRIVMVTEQFGNKLTCQLIRKQRNPRIQKQSVNYLTDDKIKESFEATLERLLTGNESEEQINAIANQIPRDLSPKIWNILSGGTNEIIIELENTTQINPQQPINPPPPDIDLTKSFFTLVYNNEELTSPIYFTDNANQIKNKIIASTASIDSNDITVTIERYWGQANTGFWRVIKIKYNGLMRPLRLEQANIVNLAQTNLGRVNLRRIAEEPTECIMTYNRDCLKPNKGPLVEASASDPTIAPILRLYYRGYVLPISISNTPSDIQQTINELDPAFAGSITVESVGGGDRPFSEADIKFTFNGDFTSIFLDTSDVVFLAGNPFFGEQHPVIDSDLVNKFKPPKISMQTIGGSAHEYTYNERMTKIQNMVHKNVNAPGIQKYRNKIRELQKYMKEQLDAGVGAAALQGAREAIHNAMTAYREMLKNVDQSSFSNDEAYKLINDTEYSLLYDMEVTGYLEWLNSFTDIDEDYTPEIDYEFTMVDVTGIRETSINIPRHWLQRLDYDDTMSDEDRQRAGLLTRDEVLYETYLLPNNTGPWLANIGDTITLAGNYQEKYVCSIIPGRIKAVYAHKNVGGINRLIPVPSSLYYKQDTTTRPYRSDSNQYLGCEQQFNTYGYDDFGLYHGVSVTLVRPLSQLNPEWSDQLYVTVESVVGPNVCDVLAWIIYTYTDLAIDLPSFQHVWALQQNYPVNFCLTGKTNVIGLIEDIAYQARCTLWIYEEKVFIRYLPEEPSSVNTITPSDIEQASLKLSYTPTEELITKYTATWRSTYAQGDDYSMVLRRNLTRYNEVSDSHEFFIYNNRNLVWKSATWWAIRKGTTWRLAQFKLYMNNIMLQTQDCITIDMGTVLDENGVEVPNTMISNLPTKAIVIKATYNSSDFSIDVQAWLPIVAGSKDKYQFAFPKNLTTQNSWPMLSDIAGGDAGSPRNMNVPSGLTYNYGGGGFNYPIDMGNPNVGDNFDTMPADPSDPLSELDYTEIAEKAIAIDANLNSDLDNEGEKHEQPQGALDGADFTPLEKHEGMNYSADIHTKITAELGVDELGVARSVPVGSTGSNYWITIKGTSDMVIATGVDIDTNKVYPKGTPVSAFVLHGKWRFRLLTAAQPETTKDSTNQLLDDKSETVDQYGRTVSGYWF